MALSEDSVHKYSDAALSRINSVIIEMRRLFLVEDLVDSLKVSVTHRHAQCVFFFAVESTGIFFTKNIY